jgi:hypothetical protein
LTCEHGSNIDQLFGEHAITNQMFATPIGVQSGRRFTVGIKEIAEKIWLVSFMHYDLGFFDHETGRVECAPNPFGAKLLPMSQEKNGYRSPS